MTDTHSVQSPSKDTQSELHKPMCGSPSFSEISQNTTLDEDGMDMSMGRSDSKANFMSRNSSMPSVNLASHAFSGELLTTSMKDGGSSPHSSNATDSSSFDGDHSAKQCKMELSYSPVLKTESTANEEANILIELSESVRKSARSNSYCESSSRELSDRLTLDVNAAASVEEVGELGTNSSCLNNLLLLKTLPNATLSPVVTRQRSSTFSASTYHSKLGARGLVSSDVSISKTPMAALTWLASMEVDDLDVANSLFELSGQFSLPGSAFKTPRPADENDEEYDVSYEEEEEDESEEADEEVASGEELQQRVKRYSHRNVELLLPGEEYIRSSKLSHKSVAVPMSANSNIVSRSASGALMGAGRARSYSMTYLDRGSSSSGVGGGASSAAASHLVASNNVMRGRSDPLSKALKRFADNKAAFGGGEGYIGIYSPEDRKERIQRFLEKRKQRMWTKKVKYDVRKVREALEC